MASDSALARIGSDELMGLYRKMVRIRLFEEKIIEIYPAQEMRTPVHLCIGQEAIAAGVCAHLRRDDYLSTTHRSHGHCLAKGMPPGVLYAEFYGRVDGCCRGKGGSMHPASPEHGILGTSAIVGGGIGLGVGNALAARLRGEDRLSAVFFGDGASEEGIFAECLSFAALKKLPVLFVCENNLYATNSHIRQRQPNQDVWKRGECFGIPGSCVDGNDAVAVYSAAKDAIASVRQGGGPVLLECKTYRWKGHVGPEEDYARGCRPQDELEEWKGKCPLQQFRNRLLQAGILPEKACDAIADELRQEIEDAWQFGSKSSFPEVSELFDHVYFERS